MTRRQGLPLGLRDAEGDGVDPGVAGDVEVAIVFTLRLRAV